MTSENRESLEKLAQANKSLDAAKAFLSTLDEVPECQVTQLVSILNADIRNAAQDILDPFDLSRAPSPTSPQDDIDNGSIGLTWISSPFAKLLRSFDPEQHTSDEWESTIQTAVQAGIATFAKHLASTWDFSTTGARHFEALYDAVKKRGMLSTIALRITDVYLAPTACIERPSVAGIWRALTRTHLRSCVPPEPQHFVNALVFIVADILHEGGVDGSGEDVRQTVAESFGADFRRIVDNALKFQRICGEQIVSMELALEDIPADDKFDRLRMVEEEVDLGISPPTTMPRDRVLCTTSLGLTSIESTSDSQAQAIRIKPKVVLWAGEESYPGLCAKARKPGRGW